MNRREGLYNIKKAAKKMQDGILSTRLARILMSYRRTALALLGLSPAELLCVRQICSKLELLHSHHIIEDILKPPFKIGDLVYVMNFGKGDMWIPGVTVSQNAKCMLRVIVPDGVSVHRHRDELRQIREHSELHSHHPDSDSQLFSPKLSNPNPFPAISKSLSSVLKSTLYFTLKIPKKRIVQKIKLPITSGSDIAAY